MFSPKESFINDFLEAVTSHLVKSAPIGEGHNREVSVERNC